MQKKFFRIDHVLMSGHILFYGIIKQAKHKIYHKKHISPWIPEKVIYLTLNNMGGKIGV